MHTCKLFFLIQDFVCLVAGCLLLFARWYPRNDVRTSVLPLAGVKGHLKNNLTAGRLTTSPQRHQLWKVS